MSTYNYERGNFGSVRHTYTWTVKSSDISECKHIGDKLLSPYFITKNPNDIESEWRLLMYPMGESEKYKNHISVFLGSYDETETTVIFSLTVFQNGKKLATFEEACPRVFKYCRVGDSKFLKRSTILDGEGNLIINDDLTVMCDIITDTKRLPMIKKLINEFEINQRLNELDMLEELMGDEDFSDVAFNFNGKVLKAHKNILSIKSPVFAAMFKHDMKEKIDSKVDIKDIDYDVFKEMLRFMYAGKVNNVKNIKHDLYMAADKYSVEGLKIVCEETFLNELRIENAMDYIKIADFYNAVNVKRQVTDFIVRNAERILEYESEARRTTSGPLSMNAVCDILRAFLDENSGKSQSDE